MIHLSNDFPMFVSFNLFSSPPVVTIFLFLLLSKNYKKQKPDMSNNFLPYTSSGLIKSKRTQKKNA